VLGAAALTTAVFGLWLLPLDRVGLGLVLAGLVLWVVPAFARWPWLWTAAGVAAFAVGALRLIDNPVPDFGVPPWVVAALCAAGIAFDIVLARAAARARRPPPPVAGVSTLVGLTGELVEFADGEGWAQIEGDYWHVQGDRALRAGRRVRVTRVQGLALQVAAEGQDAGGDAGSGVR
jgi:membrane-bound serine protease (ClpP class)